MKKASVVAAILMFVWFARGADAASVGKGDLTEFNSAALNVEYDNMLERDLRFSSWSGSATINGTRVYSFTGGSTGTLSVKDIKANSSGLLCTGSFGLDPNFELFVKIGMADINLEYTLKNPYGDGRDAKIEFDGENDLLYGAGLRGKLVDEDGFKVIADAEYSTYEVEGRWSMYGVENADSIITRAKAKVNEGHIAVVARQSIGRITPYYGVRVSYFKLTTKSEMDYWLYGDHYVASGKTVFKSDKNTGIFAGADFNITEALAVNTEVRYVDETAVTIRARYGY